jgi:phosphoribosylanthranilate isomerase
VLVATDADRAPDYEGVADGLLVDSVDETGAGGTGETHDWTRTRELVDSLSIPVVLAGGLDPEDVAGAVRTVEPYGVDVASGIERSGGVKDHDAVRAFISRARGAREVTR